VAIQKRNRKTVLGNMWGFRHGAQLNAGIVGCSNCCYCVPYYFFRIFFVEEDFRKHLLISGSKFSQTKPGLSFACCCSVCRCAGVSVFRCSGVPVCLCAGVPVCRCVGVPVCRCTGVPLCRCFGVPVCLCACVPVFRCAGVVTVDSKWTAIETRN
jgi:hypothetical protein